VVDLIISSPTKFPTLIDRKEVRGGIFIKSFPSLGLILSEKRRKSFLRYLTTY
jgi:hypothetical protein